MWPHQTTAAMMKMTSRTSSPFQHTTPTLIYHYFRGEKCSTLKHTPWHNTPQHNNQQHDTLPWPHWTTALAIVAASPMVLAMIADWTGSNKEAVLLPLIDLVNHLHEADSRLSNSATQRFSAVHGQKHLHCTVVQCEAFSACTALSAVRPNMPLHCVFCLVRTWSH